MVMNHHYWERLLSRIVLCLISLFLFLSCDTYLAPGDETRYRDMVNYGSDYIRSSNNTIDAIVKDNGYSLEAEEINNPDTNSDNWYLQEKIIINSSIYSSFISRNEKEVILKLSQ